MTNEEAKVFLDNLKICINEHPIVADWLVEIADRKPEPTGYNLSPVDKDINVRSKDEPKTCSVNGRPYTDCCNCEYFKCTADEPYEYEIKALHKDYVEPYVTIEDEPQTERSK